MDYVLMETKVMPYTFDLLPQVIASLGPKLRIAVIYGGDKNEDGAVIYKTHNPRSWKSYKQVACDIKEALHNVGFEHVELVPDDMNMAEQLRASGIHLAWLNTGGVQGYNPMSHAPAMLEMLGIPYVGHNPLTASILDNKDVFKRGLQALGIPTAPFMAWHPFSGEQLVPKPGNRFSAIFGDYRGPFVVKPVSGRGSVNVYFVEKIEELPDVAELIYEITHNHVLVEPYLSGREFCVSVSGYTACIGGQFIRTAEPFAFSTLERVFNEGETIFTSMDQRAITRERARLLNGTERMTENVLHQIARSIYRGFDLKTLVRIDVRADKNGKLYVLEANPKPDLKRPTETVTNLTSMGLEQQGMRYEDLIIGLLADCLDYLLVYNKETAAHILALLD